MELTQEQINDIVTAVFSLMESQGMLPESQLDVLAQNVKRRLQLDSVGVDEVPLVDSIEGINSLPCVRQSGSVFDVVRTPLELLKGKLAALPVFRISSGYWQVSEDNGNTWKDITDSLGNRVSAQGERENREIRRSGVRQERREIREIKVIMEKMSIFSLTEQNCNGRWERMENGRP